MHAAGIRVQLKCRASATQRQPPINKRDYRRTTRRISVQEDCSTANQPVRGAGCQPPPQSPLCPSLSLSLLLALLPPSHSLSLAVFPLPLAAARSLFLPRPSQCTCAHTRTQGYAAVETDILPSASGAHNKKVETTSLCGHVPHPPCAEVSVAYPSSRRRVPRRCCFTPGHPRAGKKLVTYSRDLIVGIIVPLCAVRRPPSRRRRLRRRRRGTKGFKGPSAGDTRGVAGAECVLAGTSVASGSPGLGDLRV